MFSWMYVWCAAMSAARNPAALASLLTGGDPREQIYERRMGDWLRARERYRSEPKSTFGFKVYLNPDDLSQTSAMIATSGWLNLPVTCLLFGALGPGMNVIDVGANLGFYTLVAAKAVGERGRVWGFEPEPLNFQLMARSISASRFDNVEAVRMALSDGPARTKLYLAPSSEPNAHTITQDRGAGSLDVPTTSLDDFWGTEGAGRLDLLKVHVYGDEPIVLRGSRRVLRELRPMVVTRFGSSRWSQDPGLLDDLLAWYDAYEVVDSPSLVRPIARSALVAGVHRGLFLAPRGG